MRTLLIVIVFALCACKTTPLKKASTTISQEDKRLDTIIDSMDDSTQKIDESAKNALSAADDIEKPDVRAKVSTELSNIQGANGVIKDRVTELKKDTQPALKRAVKESQRTEKENERLTSLIKSPAYKWIIGLMIACVLSVPASIFIAIKIPHLKDEMEIVGITAALTFLICMSLLWLMKHIAIIGCIVVLAFLYAVYRHLNKKHRSVKESEGQTEESTQES